jgi:hypothetical protein
MVRWIAHPEDASRLSGSNMRVETAADPVRSALGQPSAVILLPSARFGENLVAAVRNTTAQLVDQRRQSRKVAAYAATGLLGLDDEPVYEDEQPKKSWWRRLRGQ